MIENVFEGYNIIIGENQKENDLLVRTSDPEDYWVHISDYSSAHGIIKNPNKERINIKIIKKACMIIKMKSTKCKSINNLYFTVTKIKNLIQTDKEGEVIVKGEFKKISI